MCASILYQAVLNAIAKNKHYSDCQAMAQTQLEKYFYETRSPVYAVLFVVPLFLIYEILALTLHKLQITHLRNGADVMMRNLNLYLD